MLANFTARISERALLTLSHYGKPLPFGATVSIAGAAEEASLATMAKCISGLSPPAGHAEEHNGGRSLTNNVSLIIISPTLASLWCVSIWNVAK